jgi:hypothetical protein
MLPFSGMCLTSPYRATGNNPLFCCELLFRRFAGSFHLHEKYADTGDSSGYGKNFFATTATAGVRRVCSVCGPRSLKAWTPKYCERPVGTAFPPQPADKNRMEAVVV